MLPAAVEYINRYCPDIYDYRKYIDYKTLKTLTDDNKSQDAKSIVLRKYPKLDELIYNCEKTTGSQDMVICDMDICATICEWQNSKQIYRFDNDFLKELINTDSFHFQKDTWSHLPVSCFYADISDAKQLCNEINCIGMFIRINHGMSDSVWQLHIICIDKTCENAEYTLHYAWNEDKIIKTETFDDIANASISMRAAIDPNYDPKRDKYVREKLTDSEKYKAANTFNFVCQALTYLSSADPDINENTDETIFMTPFPSAKKKKKHKTAPSKLKTWDVGYRYGDAFRKWQKDKQIPNNISTQSASHSANKRPHYRRAHWHSFWYGKRDGERVKRVRWVSGILVNYIPKNELPAVIHDVETERTDTI